MQTVFQTIKDRLPITDVLASYLTITPAGSQYKAKCPFHQERSASFSISPERGLYYCFGCGAKGDIFTFVEQFEGVDRKGALRILAERAGVELTSTFVTRESTDPLYELLERTTLRYQAELKYQSAVMEYLTSRGLTAETISNFRIGYAPDEWRSVAGTITSTADAAIAERAGLIKKVEKVPAGATELAKQYYDRFRKRIVFPFLDPSGRVVGFSGRIFPADDTAPKYLNSPETELFQKSRILFAFDKAKFAIREHNFAILVEGQFDVVMSHQNGFRNTVASSGTAVSESATADPSTNLSVIARLTPNIFLAFDGDAAGQKALIRAALAALTLGMNPKVVPLPAGIDPADFLLIEGKDAWKELLKKSEHFIVHQLRTIDRSSLSPHALVQALRTRVFPFLARVQSPIERGRYVEIIATELELPIVDVERELANVPTTATSQPSQELLQKEDDVVTLEERLLALMMRYPGESADECRTTLNSLSFEDHTFVFPEIDESRTATLLALIERDYGALPEGERAMIMRELTHKIEDAFFAQVRASYTTALIKAERDADDALAGKLLSLLQTLNQRRHSG